MKILLMASPNFSIKMIEEEIVNQKTGYYDFTKSVDWRPGSPLGILYIAASLREAGHDIQIYDLHRALYQCREKEYFKTNNLQDFFEEYFDKILKKDNFDVLGISSLFNVSSSTVQHMAARCRKVCPSAKIIMGGHYPTNMYKQALESGNCDYVILGEAEKQLLWLLNVIDDAAVTDKISSNPHVVDVNCLNNPDKTPAIIDDIDSLPAPAWDLLPHISDYIENSIHAKRLASSKSAQKTRSAALVTTRGCPMKCTFCAGHSVHGRTVRAHSIDYMMKHIDWLVDNYDINGLLIRDDMFNFSSERAIQFCRALVEKYHDRFTLVFPSGMAIWKLNEDLIISLKTAGMKSIEIAVESGSPYVQKHIVKKNLNLDVVKEKVKLLKKHNIAVRAFYIVGLVGETKKMMEETVQFALDLNIDWSELKIFTPLVGSEMYDIAKEKGCLVGDMSEHVYGRCCIRTDEFTPEEVKEIQYDANIRINFLNNRFLKTEQYLKAENVFKSLLNSFPGHLFAQWGLWQALKGQGETNRARQALAELHELANESERNSNLLKKYHLQLPQTNEMCCLGVEQAV